LGRLYNKEAVIEYLLNKDVAPNELGQHLRNLKDVVGLNLTEKPDYQEKGADNGGEYVDRQDSRFLCPVVGLEMNGKYKFCYIRTCGCVLSDRALKEVKSEVCHKCGKEFLKEDMIVLNPGEEEMKQQQLRMEERRAKAKLERKSKKRKATETVSSAPEKGTSDGEPLTAGPVKRKEPKAGPSSSKSSLDSGKSTPSSSTTKTSTNAVVSEKASAGYSVAKDSQASEAYKSLFTSHKSAQNRPSAHWVTYNPLYF
jgi:hypothetical protein